MKYLMLVCWDAEKMDAQTEPDPTDTPDEESFPWLDDLQARGMWLTGDQLAPPRRARSVRVRDGKAIVTDGPFAETKEAVGGSTSSSAAAWRRPSRSRPDTPSRRRGRARSGRSGGADHPRKWQSGQERRTSWSTARRSSLRRAAVGVRQSPGPGFRE
jgi:hypothetical protein